MDIRAWLRGLGLERYERAFRANDIDAEILRKLTAEDLAALGVRLGRPPAQAARSHRPLPSGSPAVAARPGRPASLYSATGRAPAADGDVRRPGRLDGAVGTARP